MIFKSTSFLVPPKVYINLADSSSEVKITYDIKERFVSDHRQRIVRETGPALMKKYNIQKCEIQMPPAEEYYEKHKKMYIASNHYVCDLVR